MVSHSGKLGQFNKLTSACSSNSSKVGPNYASNGINKASPRAPSACCHNNRLTSKSIMSSMNLSQ